MHIAIPPFMFTIIHTPDTITVTRNSMPPSVLFIRKHDCNITEYHGAEAVDRVPKRLEEESKGPDVKQASKVFEAKGIVGILQLCCELFMVVVVECKEVCIYPNGAPVHQISKVEFLPFDQMSDASRKYTNGIKKLLQD
jgi:hypothetical protein